MKKVKAYFTVEAALVLPVVMFVLVALIFVMFYQYDRCLLDQDIGLLALKGGSIQTEDKNELLAQLKEDTVQPEEDKYLSFVTKSVSIKLQQGHIEVIGLGGVKTPFAAKEWNYEAKYKNTLLSPVFLIRSSKRLENALE